MIRLPTIQERAKIATPNKAGTLLGVSPFSSVRNVMAKVQDTSYEVGCQALQPHSTRKTIVSKCVVCDGDFEQERRKGRPAKCCKACLVDGRKGYYAMQDAKRRKPKKPKVVTFCAVCGNECKSKKYKTCSPKCQGKLRRTQPVSCQCCFCGSVFAVSQSQRLKLKKQMPVFCDADCAAQQKKWHNKTEEYRNRIAWYFEELASKNGGTQEQRNAAEKAKKQQKLHLVLAKNWKCCVWCDKAFTSRNSRNIACSSSCRTCIYRYIETTSVPKTIECEYCAKEKIVRAGSHAKFCSKECGSKARRQRREFWIRSNGPCEYVDLGKLVKRDSKRCRQCNCKVTRYNGSYRETDASIDHIVPLSKGGWHCWSNVQLLCMKCNSLKSDSVVDGLQLLLSITQTNNELEHTPTGGVKIATQS